ncbi:Histone-lysine N-methyltransferase, H3 lysine-79 specific [Aphelenchoides fujianensis]|nr:Histone-lysine N-methyltransferase, H3 lysine-79 specific [Aphelenchoides fujianensis]
MCTTERPPSRSTDASSLGTTSSSTKTSSSSSIDDEPKILQLTSAGGGETLSFSYPLQNNDFVEIVRMAMVDHQALQLLLAKFLVTSESFHKADYETMKEVCHMFNKATTSSSNLQKGQANPMASTKLLKRILNFCYNKAVTNERALNKHYEAFSSETYGETSFERMQLILDEIKPTPGDVFVDLGSGVGQLVAHVAGGTKVNRAFGIEIAQLPSQFAAKLEEEFRKMMKFYGKNITSFALDRGDFLDESYRKLITDDATIIFINNFAFTADLETKIKRLLLCELKHGTRVITTKPYVAVGKSVNERHMNDISSIMDVVQLQRCDNPCSWTSNDVPYYLHTINQLKLEKFFSERHLIRSSESRPSSTPSSRNSHSRESSVGFRERKNGRRGSIPFGPTTRKKWVDQTSDKKPKAVVANGEAADAQDVKKEPVDELFSSEPDSEEERKRKRAKKAKERQKAKPKEKTRRGPKTGDSKASKADGVHSSNGAKISLDAEEGMELMHRMTCAVNEGRTVEQEVLLAGLSKARRSAPSNGKKQTSMLVQPLLEIMSNPNLLKKTHAGNTNAYSSKYPELNVFICELVRVYETFLDSIQQKLGSEKMLAGTSTSAQAGDNNSAGSSSVNLETVLQRCDRIQVKQAEISDEITSMRKMIVALGQGQPPVQSPAKTNGPIAPQPVAGGLLSPTSAFTQPDAHRTAAKLFQGLDPSLLTSHNIAAALAAATSFPNANTLQSYAALSSAVTPQQLSPNVHPAAGLSNAMGAAGFAAPNNPLENSNQYATSAQLNGLSNQQYSEIYRQLLPLHSQPQVTDQLLQLAAQNPQFPSNSALFSSLMQSSLLAQTPNYTPTSNNSSFMSNYSLDAGSSVGHLPSVNSTPAPPAPPVRKSRSKKAEAAAESKAEDKTLRPGSLADQRRAKTKRPRAESSATLQKAADSDAASSAKRNCLENGEAVVLPPAVPAEPLLNGSLTAHPHLSTEKSFAS